MTSNFQPINSLAPFLKTSQFFPEEYSEFQVVISQLYKDIANNVNAREIGTYALQEQLTGQQYFDPASAQKTRQTFRKVVPFSVPLVIGLNVQAHGISVTSSFSFPHVYGGARNAAGTLFAPIPQDGVIITIDVTNINLTVPALFAGMTAVMTLEYLKN